MLPLLPRKQRLQRVDNIEATAGLWHLLSTLQERCCHRHLQDSLPAGWLTFTGWELNPLDRDERFPSCYMSFPFPGFILTLPDVISENLSLDAGPHTPAVHRVLAPVSSTMSSAFPMDRSGRLPAFILRTTSRRASFRGCRYFVMFRPPSLLAPRIVPTAANTPQGSWGFYVWAYRASLPPHARDMLTVRIQAIDGTGTLTPLDSQPCRLLPVLGCWIPFPGGTPCACACSFHGIIGLPPAKMGSASRAYPANDFSQGTVSRMQIFRNVPASKFAHPPGRSYRCEY